MIFRRSYSDPFRRDLPAICRGIDPTAAATQSNEASFQAQLALQRQQVAQWNAQRALQEGQVAEDRQRQQTQQAIGSRRAMAAAQGGDVDSGSNVDLVGDLARAGEFNALTARNNARNKAYGYRLDAQNDEAEASLMNSRASNAWIAYNNSLLNSGLQAGMSVLGSMLPTPKKN